MPLIFAISLCYGWSRKITFMNLPIHKTCVSFIMLLVMLTISLNGLAYTSCASEAPGAAEFAAAADGAGCGDGSFPVSPTDEHSVPDHNDSGCACPCHASLTVHPFQVTCSLQVVRLNYHYPFKALPEVFLPKFVPPHILA